MAGLSTGAQTANDRVNVSPNVAGGAETYAYVYDVILDETNPHARDASTIGAILYRKDLETEPTEEDLSLAFPLDDAIKSIPVRNERVEIYKVLGASKAYYRRIEPGNNKNNNAVSNAISKFYTPQPNKLARADEYEKSTNNPRTSDTAPTEYDGFGKYFDINAIHRLKLYEGDVLMESRFGQSIRLSGYNNNKNQYSPSVIIRNKEYPLNFLNTPISGSVTEDINKDGSIIAMTSGEHELTFVPGVLSDKGESNFQTKPKSFLNYPEKLNGDQTLINSGRIILSAKSGEMIFYSKKNYGFISDGALSIDNKLGIDINVNDTINIVTNDRDVSFYTGKGSIFLGSKDQNLEPLVKGKQLVKILGELIDILGNQVFLTPAGPTDVGPISKPQLSALKNRLNEFLSKQNQTT